MAALALALVAAPVASADHGVETVGSVTVGADLYSISSPYDSDALTGFFDQYRYIRDKDESVPHFVDLMGLDLGTMREDGTFVLRLERESRNAINQDNRFHFDWRGLSLEADYGTYRSQSLRFYQDGTGGNPSGLGATYAPDVEIADLFDSDRRLYIDRRGGGGEFALTPAAFGSVPTYVPTQLRIRGRQQDRTGFRQDSFLMDGRENSSFSTRFRGNRRKIDQNVTTGGVTLVAAPWKLFTVVGEFDAEGFRDREPITTLGDLAAANPDIAVPDPSRDNREFDFVPDTDRLTGSLSLARRFGRASANVSGFVSYLEQTGRQSNLQQENGLDDNAVTTVSTQASFDVPIGIFDMNGSFKYLYRENDTDERAFDLFTGPDQFGAPGQESPYLRQRDAIDGSFEVGLEPLAGTRLSVGYVGEYVDRDWRYPESGGVQPANSVVGDESQSHSLVLSGRARLLRSLQLSAELAGIWAPETAYARDFSEAISFRARSSYTFPRPVPIPLTLSVNGHVVDGENDDFVIVGSAPGIGRPKGFERTEWGYDLTLAAVPVAPLSLYATFSQEVDQQSIEHVRTDFPRYVEGLGFSLQYFIDSLPSYESDVRSLIVGGRSSILEGLDLGLSGSFSWVDAIAGASVAGDVIGAANRIESQIITLEFDGDYQLTENFRVGCGYRFQRYEDESEIDPLSIPGVPSLDGSVHTVTLRLTIDIGLLQ